MEQESIPSLRSFSAVEETEAWGVEVFYSSWAPLGPWVCIGKSKPPVDILLPPPTVHPLFLRK